MKKVLSVILAVVLIALSFGACGKKEEAKQSDMGKFRVTSYVIADQVQDKESIHTEDFNIITDVILFGCVTFDENGEVTVNTEIMNTALANLREVIGERPVKIHINALGPGSQSDSDDWNKQMDDLAMRHTNAFKSETLARDLVKVVTDNDFDGLFFDYEYPIKNKYWKPFSNFLLTVDEQLGDKILGAALSSWDIKLSKKAIEAVDMVEMMLYDNYDENGRHSTYDISVSALDDFLKRGFKREQLDFGVPFYARPTDRDAFWFSYKDFADKIDENGFADAEEFKKTAYFNTPSVIAEKTEFAIDSGLGGMMIWNYNCDLPSADERSCLKAMGETVNSYK